MLLFSDLNRLICFYDHFRKNSSDSSETIQCFLKRREGQSTSSWSGSDQHPFAQKAQPDSCPLKNVGPFQMLPFGVNAPESNVDRRAKANQFTNEINQNIPLQRAVLS